jgi:hypothetical protein
MDGIPYGLAFFRLRVEGNRPKKFVKLFRPLLDGK